MKLISRFLPRLAVLGTLITLAMAQDIPMDYCASINTGSGAGNSSIYQSDGLCRDFCTDYALSVIKDDLCWCSNVLPDSSTQVDISECDTECPGFPDDTCGGDGLWGYIAQQMAPTSTAGGNTVPSSTSSSTSSTSTTSTTTPPPETTTQEPTGDDPMTSVSVVTQDGTTRLQTVTVYPSATATADPNTGTVEPKPENNGLGTGAAVGIAVGVTAGVLLILACALYLWWRKRKEQQAAMIGRSNSGRGSSAGMMGTPRTEMASIWDSEQMSTGRRNSRIMPHDPRMDPFAGNIYGRFENKSRESVNTLQDNHDYSRRVLRATNPDPDD